MYIPDVKEIIHRKSDRGEFFTVKWGDSTHTTVKLKEGEESNEYTAFLYALGKKMFVDKGKARKYIAEKKKVFEDRVIERTEEKERLRQERAFQKALDSADIPSKVYEEMFVASGLISKSVFRKHK